MAIANVPITRLPEATSPSANDYLILQGESTQKIKWSVLLDKLYPVGCIYQSASSTSPAELFGGTWEQIKDRFILAAGDTYAAGSTGGSASHKLTVSEMPAHDHIQHAFTSDRNSNPVISTKNSGALSGATQISEYGYEADRGDSYLYTSDSGGSQPHNNMPPYIATYVWKRIA